MLENTNNYSVEILRLSLILCFCSLGDYTCGPNTGSSFESLVAQLRYDYQTQVAHDSVFTWSLFNLPYFSYRLAEQSH